jgi:hypothetical protein
LIAVCNERNAFEIKSKSVNFLKTEEETLANFLLHPNAGRVIVVNSRQSPEAFSSDITVFNLS